MTATVAATAGIMGLVVAVFLAYSFIALALGCPFCMAPDFLWPLSLYKRGLSYLKPENRVAVIGMKMTDDTQEESE